MIIFNFSLIWLNTFTGFYLSVTVVEVVITDSKISRIVVPAYLSIIG